MVEDDPAVREGLRRALTLDDYEVATASDGESALQLSEAAEPDLVLLDVVLPGIDGFSVCREIRRASRLPVLMITAKDTVEDRVTGLDCGADDYLVKPFVIDELRARIRALLRRSQSDLRPTLSYAGLTLDMGAREVYRDGRRVRVSPREYDLLVLFLNNPHRALSRSQICQEVWGLELAGESNFVDVAMRSLRKKLNDPAGRLLQTVRGFGYILAQP